MNGFPFDGLHVEPTRAQTDLIRRAKEMVVEHRLPMPDVIQPRPTNPGAIELFWVEAKLCVVFENEEEIAEMFGGGAAEPPAEAA